MSQNPFNDASRQIYRDILQEFPNLERALDPDLVAGEVSRWVPEWLPKDVALQADLGGVYVKPRKHVRILYQLTSAPGSKQPVSLWLEGRLFPKSTPEKKRQKRAEKDGAMLLLDNCLALRNASTEENLPHIQELVDPQWAYEYFTQQATRFPFPPNSSIERVTVDPFKYVPGKRMVLRYTIHFEGETLTTYAKYYHDGHGSRSATIQDDIQRLLSGTRSNASVPAVYCYDEERQITFQEDWGGELLKRNQPELQNREAWRRILQATHDLHTLQIPESVQGRIRETNLHDNMAKDVADIAELAPALEAWLAQLRARLELLIDESHAEKTGLLHGSLFPAQILTRNGDVGFIDFDGVAVGDPLYDVSELLSSVLYDEWRKGRTQDDLVRFWECAMEDYASIYGYTPARSQAVSYLLVFFLGKIHQHLKKLRPFPTDEMEDLPRFMERFLAGIAPGS